MQTAAEISQLWQVPVGTLPLQNLKTAMAKGGKEFTQFHALLESGLPANSVLCIRLLNRIASHISRAGDPVIIPLRGFGMFGQVWESIPVSDQRGERAHFRVPAVIPEGGRSGAGGLFPLISAIHH